MSKRLPRAGMPLFGGLAEPDGGLRFILRDALSFKITVRQVELGDDKALFSSLAEPFDSLREVLRLVARAVETALPHAQLRLGVALFGGLASPFQRQRVVPFNVLAEAVQHGQLVLRGNIPGFGGGRESLDIFL